MGPGAAQPSSWEATPSRKRVDPIVAVCGDLVRHSGYSIASIAASNPNCGRQGAVARPWPRHGPALDGTAASPAAPASPPGAPTSLPGQAGQAPDVIRGSRNFLGRRPRQPFEEAPTSLR